MNQVNFVGNLTKDVVLRTVPIDGKDKSVAELSIALNGISKENTTFVNVTVWGQTAENCAKFVGTGSLVEVTGYVKNHNYEKDGQKRYEYQFVAETVVFASGKKKAE